MITVEIVKMIVFGIYLEIGWVWDVKERFFINDSKIFGPEQSGKCAIFLKLRNG